jgi:hypothetical protein
MFISLFPPNNEELTDLIPNSCALAPAFHKALAQLFDGGSYFFFTGQRESGRLKYLRINGFGCLASSHHVFKHGLLAAVSFRFANSYDWLPFFHTISFND